MMHWLAALPQSLAWHAFIARVQTQFLVAWQHGVMQPQQRHISAQCMTLCQPASVRSMCFSRAAALPMPQTRGGKQDTGPASDVRGSVVGLLSRHPRADVCTAAARLFAQFTELQVSAPCRCMQLRSGDFHQRHIAAVCSYCRAGTTVVVGTG